MGESGANGGYCALAAVGEEGKEEGALVSPVAVADDVVVMVAVGASHGHIWIGRRVVTNDILCCGACGCEGGCEGAVVLVEVVVSGRPSVLALRVLALELSSNWKYESFASR